MTEAGIHADSPRWEEAREAALSDLDGLENMDVAYSLPDRLARIAGGRHSSFMSPELAQESLSAARNDADFPLPSVEVIEGDIGLVRLPGFFSDDPESWRRYCGFLADSHHCPRVHRRSPPFARLEFLMMVGLAREWRQADAVRDRLTGINFEVCILQLDSPSLG